MNVDVTINALARPYQTLLCVATLLEYNREHIGKVFLIIGGLPAERGGEVRDHPGLL